MNADWFSDGSVNVTLFHDCVAIDLSELFDGSDIDLEKIYAKGN